jgi:hypothetical protein
MPRWMIFWSILGLLVFYTARQIDRPWPGHRLLAWCVALLLFALFFGSIFANRSRAPLADGFWIRALIWTGSIALGVWATYIVFALPLDIGYWIVSAIRKLVSPGGPAPLPGAGFAFWMPVTVLAISVTTAGLGLRTALASPRVKEVSVPIRNLPQDLQGLKIVLISDLHIGRTHGLRFAEEVAQKVLALQPTSSRSREISRTAKPRCSGPSFSLWRNSRLRSGYTS